MCVKSYSFSLLARNSIWLVILGYRVGHYYLWICGGEDKICINYHRVRDNPWLVMLIRGQGWTFAQIFSRLPFSKNDHFSPRYSGNFLFFFHFFTSFPLYSRFFFFSYFGKMINYKPLCLCVGEYTVGLQGLHLHPAQGNQSINQNFLQPTSIDFGEYVTDESF